MNEYALFPQKNMIKNYFIGQIEEIFQVFLFLFVEIGPPIHEVQVRPKFHDAFGGNIEETEQGTINEVENCQSQMLVYNNLTITQNNTNQFQSKKIIFTLQCCEEMQCCHHANQCRSPLWWL